MAAAKLLTKEIERRLPALYSQEEVEDPTIIVKWFSIASDWRWYAYEGEPIIDEETGERVDFRFFGLTTSPMVGQRGELGYWHLSELESVTAMAGRLPLIERDVWWTDTPLSAVREGKAY